MQTQIVARVAEMIRNPAARNEKRSAEVKELQDKVELSSVGKQKSADLAKVDSQWEKERLEHVDQIKKQVQNHSYSLAPEMVDKIASKIYDIL